MADTPSRRSTAVARRRGSVTGVRAMEVDEPGAGAAEGEADGWRREREKKKRVRKDVVELRVGKEAEEADGRGMIDDR